MDAKEFSPIVCELIKNMAYLRTMGLVMLNDEQLDSFQKLFKTSLEAVINELITDYPDLFASEIKDLKTFLTRNMN